MATLSPIAVYRNAVSICGGGGGSSGCQELNGPKWKNSASVQLASV
jgi:hypothetical protein